MSNKNTRTIYDIGDYTDIDIRKVVELIRERANFVSDFWEQGYFFFKPPITEGYD